MTPQRARELMLRIVASDMTYEDQKDLLAVIGPLQRLGEDITDLGDRMDDFQWRKVSPEDAEG